MSGYIGNPDAESEHAIIMSENGINASRMMLVGSVRTHCLDCGDPIPEARVAYAIKTKMKCMYCVTCQQDHDVAPRVKMLDRIL